MKSRSPLVNRIGLVVGAIVLTALVAMASTLAVSQSIEGNATAINLAGSLRMGAYQLLAVSNSQETALPSGYDLEAATDRYQERLHQFGQLHAVTENPRDPIHQQYRDILEFWSQSFHPRLIEHQAGRLIDIRLLEEANQFVTLVDNLVTNLERQTEARISLLHFIQIVSLALSIVIVIVLFIDLKKRVVRPLRKLVSIAEAIGDREFSHRINPSGSDELALLGKAFDQMSEELAVSYHQLESEALDKTRELEKSHQALEILHSASRTLFANHDLCSGAIPMLHDLEALLGIGPIRLYLHDKEASEPIEALNTTSTERPYYCRDHSCNACLVTPEVYDELPSAENDGRRLLLPIRTPGLLLGTLEVWYPVSKGLSATARRLLETLSDQLATAIFLEKQITEEQQLTLAEERAVIARELHDSLAQSLSYLKIQVARLRRVYIEGPHQELHGQILEELSTGLNSAYRQLRELLTTFRLKLDTPDLASALRQTVAEFSERLGHAVELDYQLPPQTLSPNEEIHTLQIVREALANAVKHAGASEVKVQVAFQSPQVQIRVLDNGKGLPDAGQPPAHYGLIIMQDRTRTLGGKIRIQNREEGGVEVVLTFVPKSRHLIPSEAVHS